ncbi:MAG: hypothetical protein RSP_17700 [Rhodanobacter sp.]
MAREIRTLFLEQVPADHPPAVWIRRLDTALLLGGVAAGAVSLGVSAALWHALPHMPAGGFLSQWWNYPRLLAWSLEPHAPMRIWADNPASYDSTPAALHWRLLPGFLAGIAAGIAAFRAGFTPWRRMRHIEGPRLLEGKEAMGAARQVLNQELRGPDGKPQEGFLPIHPQLPWLHKTRFTRGVLMVGSPGSGKSTLLHLWLKEVFRANHRAFIFDTKADFTAGYLGKSCILMCPWDKRSYVWAIARDCLSPSDAAALASSLIPRNDKDPFWTTAAAMLLEGTLRSLQDQYGTDWDWLLLQERVNDELGPFVERMKEHYPKAVQLLGEGATSQSITATLSGYTKIIDELATAWRDGRDRAGNFRPHFSFREWIRDDYTGKARQIILQAGPDKHATEAFASSIVNVLAPAMLSPAFGDNEMGRSLLFFWDELPAIGRIDFAGLVERGRSRGICVFASCQNFAQLEAVHGKHVRETLMSMFGTQVIFRMQPSKSRDEIAEGLGKARWSITAVNTNGQGSSTSVHEENRAVVQPHEIGDLGKQTGRRYPGGWAIRAMVSGVGPDILTLDFPGTPAPKRRSAHRPAKWTLGPAKPGTKPEPTKNERRLAEAATAETQKTEVKQQEEARRKDHRRQLDAKWREAREALEEAGIPKELLIKAMGSNKDFIYEARHEPEPGPDHRDPEANPFAELKPSAAIERIKQGAAGH